MSISPCVDYAKNRRLWGQEIGQFQLIQLKLAGMEVARMNVRNILFRVIESAQSGKSISLPEASAIVQITHVARGLLSD
jgi:hypothetical protein